MQNVDCLIHARWIVPVTPADTILENHGIAVRNGRIDAILPSSDLVKHYSSENSHNLDNHVVIPGLINAHTHAAMSLMRGLADDLPLMTWLKEHIWPAESAHVDQDFVRDGSRLAVAEMLRSGTTCFNDMYFYPDEVAKVAIETGMRVCVGLIVLGFPTVWADTPQEYISKGIQVHDRLRNDPLVHTAFAPHAPYTVDNATLEKIRVLSEELDIPIHMHVHETKDEIRQSLENYNVRPMERLKNLGLLNNRLIAVHMTQLEDEEIETAAESGIHVVHCPESNMKLASGLCPVTRLAKQGVNVAIGTDGAASNNDLSMLGEMRSGALLAKIMENDASALPAFKILEMATINSAKALGLENETGSLVPGKAADIVAINLADIETQPVFNPVSHLVYCVQRDNISDVWVAGRHLLKNREMTTLDMTDVLEKTRDWYNKLVDN